MPKKKISFFYIFVTSKLQNAIAIEYYVNNSTASLCGAAVLPVRQSKAPLVHLAYVYLNMQNCWGNF